MYLPYQECIDHRISCSSGLWPSKLPVATAVITTDERESSNVSPRVLKRVDISETYTGIVERRQRVNVGPSECRGAVVIGPVHPC